MLIKLQQAGIYRSDHAYIWYYLIVKMISDTELISYTESHINTFN